MEKNTSIATTSDEKIKEIAEQLILNTAEEAALSEGVYDASSILLDIVKGRNSKETGVLKRAIKFIEDDGFNCDGFGIDFMLDNTVNGDDTIINSYLIRFIHRKEPQTEFSLEVEKDSVSFWNSQATKIGNALIRY